MSVAGGLENALDRGRAVGADCLQIFVKNQRQWQVKPLEGDEIARFRRASAQTVIAPVVAHAGYLINLASTDPVLRSRSIQALVDEANRCGALGIRMLVVHPGARLDSTLPVAIKRVGRSINAVHERTPSHAMTILLETTASNPFVCR